MNKFGIIFTSAQFHKGLLSSPLSSGLPNAVVSMVMGYPAHDNMWATQRACADMALTLDPCLDFVLNVN